MTTTTTTKKKSAKLVSGTPACRAAAAATASIHVMLALLMIVAACGPAVNAAQANQTHAAHSAHSADSMFANFTRSQRPGSGNELWDSLVQQCMARPTISCFQKNVYAYLDETLQPGNVSVMSGLRFVRNELDEASLQDAGRIGGNRVDGGAEGAEEKQEAEADEGRSASPLEEVTDSLAGKGINFLMMHNMELRLPDTLFDGATVRVSPRSFEGNGALLHLEVMPAAAKEKPEASRFLLKPFKKLKKLFRNKLLLSFLAIVLIVKLIKVKLFWILPFIVGVGTAKKLMLKVILFLFPALAHIFKLCSYYHKNYHDGTKYHHHNHQISHLHSVVPPWFNEPHHDNDPHSSGGGYPSSVSSPLEPELIYTSPPKGHPSEYLHGGPPFHQHPQDWELSGPGLGSEYISDRNSHVNAFRPKLDELNEVSSLGAVGAGVRGTTTRTVVVHRPVPQPSLGGNGGGGGHHPPPHVVVATAPNYGPQFNAPAAGPANNRIITSAAYHRQVFTPKHSPGGGPAGAATSSIQQQQQQVSQQYATVTDEKMLREAQRLQAKQLEALRQQAEQKLIAQQQLLLPQQQPFAYNPDEVLVPQPQPTLPAVSTPLEDPVYSPILLKIDKILQPLGFGDEPCKERLICSMYRSPQKYSPHSNFVSAELSRDMSELQKPSSPNAAVVRFYRYVQAARDGQDQRDCLQIYGLCTRHTEQ